MGLRCRGAERLGSRYRATTRADATRQSAVQRPIDTVYLRWRDADWDFGSVSQYPILKYTAHPDADRDPICDAPGMPRCGALIAPLFRNGLENLRIVGTELFPPFASGSTDYTGTVDLSRDSPVVSLVATAFDADARIDIYEADGETLLVSDLASGEPSSLFPLTTQSRRFVIEVKGVETVRQSITLNRRLYSIIDSLEDLNAIRNSSDNYRLVRDLDFNDANSYASGEVNPDWTMVDFNASVGTGWPPIASFSGTLDGNGYTISNLQINRDNSDNVGLFSTLGGENVVVRNLGLIDVEIEGGNLVGALAGYNNTGATIENCFVIGSGDGESTVRGTDIVGGMVGRHDEKFAKIINSYADVSVKGQSEVGGLVGLVAAAGIVINSYATGSVSGNDRVGGLVGALNQAFGGGLFELTMIINSHATGDVTGQRFIGGLVGFSNDRIINSYATGKVTSTYAGNMTVSIGGLVGENQTGGTIINSYATGDVAVTDDDVSARDSILLGSLVGDPGNGTVRNSYATGNIPQVIRQRVINSGRNNYDGFIGDNNSGPIVTASYWNSNLDENVGSQRSRRTTRDLQTPIGPDVTAPLFVYTGWSTDDWDFGSNTQYPILKYTQSPAVGDTGGSCGDDGLPACGTLISPELRYGLSEIEPLDGELLSPPFDGSRRYYYGTVTLDPDGKIRLIVRSSAITAGNIAIFAGREETPVGSEFSVGDVSDEITLVAGINRIVVEVSLLDSATPPFRYQLYLVSEGATDAVASQTPINYLEDLNLISAASRDGKRDNYILNRNLDFEDPDSYRSGINRSWVVRDFRSTTDTGWTPIPIRTRNRVPPDLFTFDGNGYTISNLQVNRDNDSAGLFSVIDTNNNGFHVIRNLGLLNVTIEGRQSVGGIAGSMGRTRIYNSYVTGSVTGINQVGGLVGYSINGTIGNSYVKGTIIGRDGDNFEHRIGGLVGRILVFGSDNFLIFNSYADVSLTSTHQRGQGDNSQRQIGGLVGRNVRGDIHNSYSAGSVEALGRLGGDVGGLVGFGFNTENLYNYTIAEVKATENNITAGGLVGQLAGTSVDTANYWNADTSPSVTASAAGTSRTTSQLITPTAPGATEGDVYHQWSTDNWDFGTDTEYPILKHAPGPDDDGDGRGDACGTEFTPDCDALLLPEPRYGFIELSLGGDDFLDPPLDPETRDYKGTVVDADGDNIIRLVQTTKNPDSTVRVYIGDSETPLGAALRSGQESEAIPLVLGRNLIDVEIDPNLPGIAPFRYTLDLLFDRPTIEINYLEDLAAINDAPNFNYRLTGNLDFEDNASYRDLRNRNRWITSFGNTGGWSPITNFSGTFDGNGYTISNLQIVGPRSGSPVNIGLFATIATGGIVRNLGLLNLRIDTYVGGPFANGGGIAAINRGTVINSYAIGTIEGANGGILVGRSERGSHIINSYAVGTLYDSERLMNFNGGLAGTCRDSTIVNSHAHVEIGNRVIDREARNVGGLVGSSQNCNIHNSFAVGRSDKVNDSGDISFGGLIGVVERGGTVQNNYAYVDMAENLNAGGLLGGVFNSVMNTDIFNNYAIGTAASGFLRHYNESGLVELRSGANYWDIDTSRTVLTDSNVNASGQTTEALQLPISTDDGIYQQWGEENWDFGTNRQYPILKYAAHPDPDADVQTCRRADDDSTRLPVCGDLIAPQLRYGLKNLDIADGTLTPAFTEENGEHYGSYLGTAFADPDAIRLIPTAFDDRAEIRIYRVDGKGERQLGGAFASGGTSEPITLNQKSISRYASAINYLIVEIDPEDPAIPIVRYPVYLMAATPIRYLEDLDALRQSGNELRNSVLVRDLDFEDPDSYRSGVVNRDWTVVDFSQPQRGWWPIRRNLRGIFDGNGHTLSNLRSSGFEGQSGIWNVVDPSGIVRNLGLLDVKIGRFVASGGTLAERNDGTIIGSYAVVDIITSRARKPIIGGLVGTNRGRIFNSYAVGSITMVDDPERPDIRSVFSIIGGLVGFNSNNTAGVLNALEERGLIVNSYADVSISTTDLRAGGLVGLCDACDIRNSFARGAVVGRGPSVRSIGGFVGRLQGGFSLSNNYASGSVSRTNVARSVGDGGFFGGLAGSAGSLNANYSVGMTDHGFGGGRVSETALGDVPNYWNTDTATTSGTNVSINASGKTTEMLRMPTTASGIYRQWSEDNWDFGTDTEYPVLKHTLFSSRDYGRSQSCRNTVDDLRPLPVCGSLIGPTSRSILKNLTLADGRELLPAFTNNGSYSGEVVEDSDIIRLIPTAFDGQAEIRIYVIDGNGERQVGATFGSGGTSAPITLDANVVNRLIVEIISTDPTVPTIRYPLYLSYRVGPTKIDSLEALDAIRNRPDGDYILTRNLDFNDDDSYEDLSNKDAWTVSDYQSPVDLGWLPIGAITDFTGTFNGAGHTISNLQINNSDERIDKGLFGTIGASAVVRNIGLLDVNIVDNSDANTAALVGTNNGRVVSAYAQGTIVGGSRSGGLVGWSGGEIVNSHTVVSVHGQGEEIGGLVGYNEGNIGNSSAAGDVAGTTNIGGLVGHHRNGAIYHSYVNSRVSGDNGVGGLLGFASAGNISDVYTTGRVDAQRNAGGLIGSTTATVSQRSYSIAEISAMLRDDSSFGSLVGRFEGGAELRDSYFNSDRASFPIVGQRADDTQITNASALTTVDLQLEPENTSTFNRLYGTWRQDWDFGTSVQYPILVVSPNPDRNGARTCGTFDTPLCRTLLRGNPALRTLRFLSGQQSPDVDLRYRDHIGTIVNNVAETQLLAVATDPDAQITFYLNDRQHGERTVSGTAGASSAAMTLGEDGLNRIAVEVITPAVENDPGGVDRYNLSVRFRQIDSDRNGNPFIEIATLEDLDAIRDNTSRSYILTADLDFNDDNSYGDLRNRAANKAAWTVDNFAASDDEGWQPIDNFSGEFDGNGYTIFNLQINRDTEDDQGLFAVIADEGVVRNISLFGAMIEARNNVGVLAGRNNGTVVAVDAYARIDANNTVGGLIGNSRGWVIGSNAVVVISAVDSVGGLVGSSGATIINSYASGAVIAAGNRSGGLVGDNSMPAGRIINSYAETEVTGNSEVGGLVGHSTATSVITDSYAAGSVRAVAEVDSDGPYAGGLIGRLRGASTVKNSYAIAAIEPDTRQNFVGGLIGNNGNRNEAITASYWDRDTTGQTGSAGGAGSTTIILQSATSHTNSGQQNRPYYLWSVRNWNFGTAEQYPTLKYAPNPDREGPPTCGSAGLPECGSPLTPQLRNSLEDLKLASTSQLVPPFDASTGRHRNSYFGSATANPIRLIPTASQDDAVINIYAADGSTLLESALASGGTSRVIFLSDDINRIVLEIVAATTATVRYPVYIRRIDDVDGDGFIDIENLEELRAITEINNRFRNYELLRSLDFNDPDSYGSGEVNREWTVEDFNDRGDFGWQPASFAGEFNGNGYTISGLQINRVASDNVGLFSRLDTSGMIRNLGLLNLRIKAGSDTGGLIGENSGTVINCFVIGEIEGNTRVGGLIGVSRIRASMRGGVINSYAEAMVSGVSNVGGLVGENPGHKIYNSYAGGRVVGGRVIGGLVGSMIPPFSGDEVNDADAVVNSYATGNVTSTHTGNQTVDIGGLIGVIFRGNNLLYDNTYTTGQVDGNDSAGGLIGTINLGSASLRNSYAAGRVDGNSNVGGLVGRTNGTIARIQNSYVNSDENPGISLGSGSFLNSSTQTSARLRQGTAQSITRTDVYYRWSTDDWDFGNALQYPILKYAPTTGTGFAQACGNGSDDLPECGTPISPQIHDGLQDLSVADGAELDPPFGDMHRDLSGSYFGDLSHDASTLRIIPTAKVRNTTINIYVGDVGGKQTPDQQIASGTTSTPITLVNGINRIVLEIVAPGRATVRYPVYLRFDTQDRNRDGIIEIANLNELYNIRHNLSGNYRLVRNLDFDDPNSYAPGRYPPGEINREWTVLNFSNPADRGWQPIGTRVRPFRGEFDADGFTIANLRINDTVGADSGLFGSIGGSGVVRNLGLLDVRIQGRSDVGGLSVVNRGRIIGTYVIGELSGGYRRNIGGLVGENAGGEIVNSYAQVTLTAHRSEANNIGGLVGMVSSGGAIVNSHAGGILEHRGLNSGGLLGSTGLGFNPAPINIVNSYAEVRVAGVRHVGGLVGNLAVDGDAVRNSYARGEVSEFAATDNANQYVGGLVGLVNKGSITDSYAANNIIESSAVQRENIQIGSLIGAFLDSGITVSASYADFNRSRYNFIGTTPTLNSFNRTTEQLQNPIRRGESPDDTYHQWSETDWNFGDRNSYPILKYAAATNVLGRRNAACRNRTMDEATRLPICGELISPSFENGLVSLALQDGRGLRGLSLNPPFGDANLNLFGYYSGAVRFSLNSTRTDIRLIPGAKDPSSTIDIYVNGVYKEQIFSNIPSDPIELTEGITFIVLEIRASGSEPVRYPVYLSYDPRDRNGNGFTEINNLEELYDIRADIDTLSDDYELTRDLDFNDPNSYASGIVNRDWTVERFDSPTDFGWEAIGGIVNDDCDDFNSRCFGGTFNGNGYTISNLSINGDADYQGLFVGIAGTGNVRALGLANLKIEAGDTVGGLAGRNEGTVIDSFAIGELSANDRVGGLVGINKGTVMDSYAIGELSANDSAGGLVGISEGTIIGSYAITELSANNDVGGLVGESIGKILNSYAGGVITGNTGVGGLVGTATDMSGSGMIVNSHAGGIIHAFGDYAGGIVGRIGFGPGNEDFRIINSYANSLISSDGQYIGGLVSDSASGKFTISNSYAAGRVTESAFGNVTSIGGLAAVTLPDDSITDSYAVTEIYPQSAAVSKGSLVGNHSGRLASVYSDAARNPYIGITGRGGGQIEASSIRTTAEMQSATGPSTTQTGVYYNWDANAWDFGRRNEYPIPRYVSGPDADACGTDDTPSCGTVISPQTRYRTRGHGLRALNVKEGALYPRFDIDEQNRVGVYIGAVVADNAVTELIATTMEADATYSVYLGDREIPLLSDARSGTTTTEITLSAREATRIVIEVKRTETVRYILYLKHLNNALAVDADHDGLIEIDSLEDLNAIRFVADSSGYRANARTASNSAGCPNGLCRGYELTGDLDFNDPDDYENIDNRARWHDDGSWPPIGNPVRFFTGTLNGNGFAISNLKVRANGGLFGVIGSDREAEAADVRNFVRGLGLLNVDIQGDTVGGIARYCNRCSIDNTYVVARIEGTESAAGFVNEYSISATSSPDISIHNSYFIGRVDARHIAGGFIGSGDFHPQISDSYVIGRVIAGSSVAQVGSFAATGLDNFDIARSFAAASATRAGVSQGLSGGGIGNGSIRATYIDGDIAGLQTAGLADVQSTEALQMPTGATGIYSRWRTENWDFGTPNNIRQSNTRNATKPLRRFAVMYSLIRVVCSKA